MRVGKKKRNKYEKHIRSLYKKRRKLVDQLFKSPLLKRKEELEIALQNDDEELQTAILEREQRKELSAIQKNIYKYKVLFHIC